MMLIADITFSATMLLFRYGYYAAAPLPPFDAARRGVATTRRACASAAAGKDTLLRCCRHIRCLITMLTFYITLHIAIIAGALLRAFDNVFDAKGIGNVVGNTGIT